MFGSESKRPVVLAVSSGGGHWVQMCRLAPAFAGAEVHYATTDASAAEVIGSQRLHVYPDANKDTPLRLALCVLRLAWIVFRLRPQIVVSTGAAGGFLAIRLARLIGARTMFIDSIANARELSISARLSLGVADRVLSQWPGVAAITGAEYRGALI
jgi:UDP-N-acetylglucosamine:LPS N-acetylglucosamine transferase